MEKTSIAKTLNQTPVSMLHLFSRHCQGYFHGDSLDDSSQGAFVTIDPAVVPPPPQHLPEPASAFLFALGILALFGLMRNKKQRVRHNQLSA